MLPEDVKSYGESYQWLWKNRPTYQWFRFSVMNMWVDDKYDLLLPNKESKDGKA